MKILILIILLPIPVFLSAQSDTVQTFNLDPITITATKTEIPRSLVSPSMTVISTEVLERNPQKSVFSIISEQVPGVFSTERGIAGFGVNTQAGQTMVRGVGGNPTTEVLMLIDGRPQYMGLMGHPVNDSYLSAHVERVEVVRGPASMLYGTNAMGGVINLVTVKNASPGISTSASAVYGSYDTRHLGARIGYQSGDWNTVASFTNTHTNGHRVWSEYSANSGYLKSSYTINKQYSVFIDGSLTKFNTYDPGTITSPSINNWMHINRGYVGASIDNIYEHMNGSLRFSYNFGHHELSPYYGNKSWISDDYVFDISFYQSMNFLADNTFTIGVDVQKNGGTAKNTSQDYGSPSVYEYALYVHAQQLVFQKFHLTAGVRTQVHEIYGSTMVPQFGVAYKLNEEMTLRGTVAKGFRSPTIGEMYMFAPTTTLQPERMWNYEIGYSFTTNNFTADLAGFVAEGDNLIRMIAYKSNGRQNSGSFIHRGVEVSAAYIPLSNVQFHGNYSFIDAGKETRSVPKHKMYADVQYEYGVAIFNVSAQHIESIFGSDNSRDRLPAYTLINMKASARILPAAMVSVGVDNILDEIYYTLLGYPMPGTTVSVGINWTMP